MTLELSGLVAIITGGASGIGAAAADRMSSMGAQVAVLDLSPPTSDDAHFALQADVSDDESVRRAIDLVLQRFGRLDIVVNNAGIGAQGAIGDNSEEEWHRVFDINVLGIVRVSRAALPFLRASPVPAIVNTASVAATVGLQNRALYSASKGAVVALTLSMAADHVHEGIRVNCVNPGTADTPWVERLLQTAADPVAERVALESRQPHGRLVKAEEIAAAIAYLASPSAGSTTGTALAVDGGMHSLRLRPGD